MDPLRPGEAGRRKAAGWFGRVEEVAVGEGAGVGKVGLRTEGEGLGESRGSNL